MKPKIIRLSTIPLSLNLLLQGQLKMLSEDYDVTAVSSPGADLEAVAAREGVKTLAIPMERRISPFKDLVSLVRLVCLFWKERPYLVHSLTPKAGLLSMTAAWICRVPVRMHTFTGLVFPTATGWRKKLLIATDRMTCRCATYINPEGEGVKKDLERYHISSRPLHIIGNGNINGIDLTHYDRTPQVMKEAEKYREKGCFTFCYVGRIVRDKGMEELVTAFDRLHRQCPDCRLWLVGDFEQRLDPIKPETQDRILHHCAIRFMGWQEDIRPFLAAADAFVFPSYREGFPNVVLQAGAMGLPCIVTDINGCNEIISHQKNGLIIPARDEERLHNAMYELATQPNQTAQYASEARIRIAQRYDRETLWKALREVYGQLCGTPRQTI